jgi:hypothetical protein
VRSASATLTPLVRIADVVGADKIYNPRQPYETTGISPDDDAACDSLTGAQYLVAAGPLRVVCHRDAASPAALELLAIAGHTVEAEPLVYACRDEYEALLEAAGDGEVVYQHAQPESGAHPETYAVERDVLLRVTNKGRLHELVAAEHLPARRVIPTGGLVGSVPPGELPVVVKAACDESLGGGDGVRICRSEADVAAAARDFRAAPEVVVEELVDVISNWCVNFAIVPEEPVRYLGASEQIVSSAGAYEGSRIGRVPPGDVVAVGRSIAIAVREEGYRGIAGFDVVETADRRTVALDLNCRLNACTTALLLRHDLAEWSGSETMVAGSWETGLDDSRLLDRVAELVDRRLLVPTGSFLPRAGERRLWGIAFGAGVLRVRAALA